MISIYLDKIAAMIKGLLLFKALSTILPQPDHIRPRRVLTK